MAAPVFAAGGLDRHPLDAFNTDAAERWLIYFRATATPERHGKCKGTLGHTRPVREIALSFFKPHQPC
jgi:hypothetical protein